MILTKDLSADYADYADWRRVEGSFFYLRLCANLRIQSLSASHGNHAASAAFGIRSSTLENMGYQWILYSTGIQIHDVLRALRVKFFISAPPRLHVR